MTKDFVFSLSALIALLPAALIALRRGGARDGLYWTMLAVAVAGPLAWVVALTSGAWQTGFSTTLWVIAATSMVLFAVLTLVTRQAWRLTALVIPYVVIVGILAIVWQQDSTKVLSAGAPPGWIQIHIIVSVLTYGLITIAAIAALAAVLQERALKIKRPTSLSRSLPSVADSESLQVRLLVAGEIVLAMGLASGMATYYSETGLLFAVDHKTILSLAAFLLIGALLAAQFLSGVRGRMAARLVLLAYLLLTLGYPGVKFVTDVIMA